MARRIVSEGVRWICGLLVLLAVDLFAELYVFEWLQWNGTDKNDWFFMLWWAVVLIWTLSCGRNVLRGKSDLADEAADNDPLSSDHD